MSPATMPEAPSGASTVRLMSRFERFRLHLEPPQEQIDQHHGKYRVPGTGKVVRFQNYRATVPAELIPEIEATRDFKRGVVGLEQSWTGLSPRAAGPQIVNGASAASVSRINQAPRAGWDQATARQIVEWIESGQIADLEHARAYEMAHQRRKMVVRAITDAQLDGTVEQPAQEIAPVFTAPLPEGVGGDL